MDALGAPEADRFRYAEIKSDSERTESFFLKPLSERFLVESPTLVLKLLFELFHRRIVLKNLHQKRSGPQPEPEKRQLRPAAALPDSQIYVRLPA